MDFLSNNLPALILMVAGIGLVVLIVLQAVQISAMRHRIDQLTGGAGEGNLEDVLIQHLESVHTMGQELDELIARTAFLESTARHHYSRQGLVRFNPFPDTGGNQSFTLALLDESNDGFIVSSLHSRTGTRIYAKSVVAGKTDATLSSEETQAIEEAMARRPATSPSAKARAAASAGGAARGARSGSSASNASASSPAPVRAATAKSAPARAAEPAVPVVQAAVVTPAPAVEPMPTPVAAPVAQDESEPVRENASRPASSKGQSKSDLLPAAEESGDDEKTGARPGRSATPRP